MPALHVDFQHPVQKIKPMHAMGQPPFAPSGASLDFSHMRHLQNARVPYSRLHDVGGPYGGNRYVDIPNLFRDFDADENDPASYDFAFTDALLEAMAAYELKPIFRLGVTIENQASIKAYRLDPPKDFHKWARICEHVIRHYNEGWANGYHYDITYWEIWNEPENGPEPATNQMWTGTPEQYFALYDVTAKHLKACFGDRIKVGGYGSCGFAALFFDPERYGFPNAPKRPYDAERVVRYGFHITFLHQFLAYIKAHQSPIDFFSWHSYSDVEKTVIMDQYLHRVLTEYGYGGLETHLNEWNCACGNQNHGTSFASASVAAMLCAMQNAPTDLLCYYDSRLQASAYGGLFAPLTYEPVCTYYPFLAFGHLYALGTQVACECTEAQLYALAATGAEGNALMISNCAKAARTVTTNLTGVWEAYRIDRNHLMTPETIDPTSFTIQANQVIFFKQPTT